MSDDKDPIADWRKYPKSPSFLWVVLAACAFILIAFLVLWLVVRRDGQKMIPHGPNRTPNSLVEPFSGGSAWPAVRS